MKRSDSGSTNPWKAAGLVSAIGADLVVCMVGGFFAGDYLASKTGQAGWTVAGLLFGMFVGIFTIVMLIKRFLEENDG